MRMADKEFKCIHYIGRKSYQALIAGRHIVLVRIMARKKLNISMDKIGLVIIGSGASLFYYYLEESLAQTQGLESFITIASI